MRGLTRWLILFGSPAVSLTKSHAETSTIFIKKFNTCVLDSFLQLGFCLVGDPWAEFTLEPLNRRKRQSCASGKFRLRPTEKASGGAQLIHGFHEILLDPFGIIAYDPFRIIGNETPMGFVYHSERKMDGDASVSHKYIDRRAFIGGSDARIIMGNDEAVLVRLWQEKRGEVEPKDLSDNLVVQLGTVTEALNRRWYERNTGRTVGDVQKRLRHPIHKWMAATLDGLIEPGGEVFEAKFMLPWTFSEEAAAEKYMPQLQHNMWVVHARSASLSIITGGGKWVEVVVWADPLYQHLLLTAERKFWRCVISGETPRLFGVEPPRARRPSAASI